MENSEAKFEYDIQKRARAGTSATLRAAVALYIIYLGWSIIRGVREGSSDMAPWIGWTAGIVLIAAAVGFGFYIVKRYRQDLEAARIPLTDPDEADSGPDETPESTDGEFFPSSSAANTETDQPEEHS